MGEAGISEPEALGQRLGAASGKRRLAVAAFYPWIFVAAVQRKSLPDLVSSVTNGKFRYALGDLAALPRAAVVVEDRYSALLKQRHARPAAVADALAEAISAGNSVRLSNRRSSPRHARGEERQLPLGTARSELAFLTAPWPRSRTPVAEGRVCAVSAL